MREENPASPAASDETYKYAIFPAIGAQLAHGFNGIHLDGSKTLLFACSGLIKDVRWTVPTDPTVNVGSFSTVKTTSADQAYRDGRGCTYTLPPRSSHTGTPSVLPLMSHKAMSRPDNALMSTSPPR